MILNRVESDDRGGTQTDERLTLQAALGMRASQSYLVSERNLLGEGVHDYWIITELSNIFEREDRACLPVRLASFTVFSQLLPLVSLTQLRGVCFRSQRLRPSPLDGRVF